MKKVLIPTLVVTGLALAFTFNSAEALAFGGEGKGYNLTEEQRMERDSHREEMMQEKAGFIGITVEELKEAWETRTLRDLLNEKGISPMDMFNQFKERMMGHMSERGLSSEDIAERVANKEARIHSGDFGSGQGSAKGDMNGEGREQGKGLNRQ